MARIISYIAKETGGANFNSHKYKHENMGLSTIQYDDFAEYNLKYLCETRKEDKSINLKLYAEDILSKTEPLFAYFLDGSRRTFKVDDISYNQEVFPIIAGQVCVACCKRQNKNMEAFKLRKHNVIALPKKSFNEHIMGSQTNELKDKINNQTSKNIEFSKILPYKTADKDKLEDKAVAEIQTHMMKEEQNMVKELVDNRLLSQNKYLLKDGSLEYKNQHMKEKELYKFKEAYKYIVGVSKSFNPANFKDKRGNVITENVANLPLYHRTPVSMYEYEKLKFAVWYIRIRDIKYTNDIYSGILKIEKILVTDKEIENGIDSEEVDLISANIINERNPVCYGNDKRWANHLYPVYITEQYAKSQYLSNQMFLNIF